MGKQLAQKYVRVVTKCLGKLQAYNSSLPKHRNPWPRWLLHSWWHDTGQRGVHRPCSEYRSLHRASQTRTWRASGMLHSTYRRVLKLIGLTMSLMPVSVFAEVSDKEPAAGLFWVVGVAAAALCLASARYKSWLGMIVFLPFAIWFLSLFTELHSADVGPYLRAEQGLTYYLQAYGAFGLVLIGLLFGLFWPKKKTRR